MQGGMGQSLSLYLSEKGGGGGVTSWNVSHSIKENRARGAHCKERHASAPAVASPHDVLRALTGVCSVSAKRRPELPPKKCIILLSPLLPEVCCSDSDLKREGN